MESRADAVEEVHDQVLHRAAVLRECGHEQEAELLEKVKREYEVALKRYEDELLTVQEAAVESGFSKEHLRRLIRNGTIPDRRPEGSQGRIQIRRRDLPRKAWGERAD